MREEQHQWLVNSLGAAILVTINMLGHDIVGGLSWTVQFWLSAGLAVFAVTVMLGLSLEVDRIEQWAAKGDVE